MTAPNLLAYAAQVTIIVLACAGLPRLLRLRSPTVQYAFWRTTLVVCLMLPFAQPWKAHEMRFVPAPVQGAAVLPAPPGPDRPAGPSAVSTFDAVAAAGFVVLFGIVARLGWIGAGMIRLRRIRRRATEAAGGFDDLQQSIGAAAPILWSAEVRHPVTFGLFDPVVLLPLALKAAAPPAQRAVVAHELHHVHRRDWGWVVAEELIRSIFWFHPAVWWLVSRVQLARETVVDELSILATNARRTYLDTLLAFADDSGLASSPAFSARRHLFHRVMLLSQEGEMSSIRVAFGSCVLALALAAGTVEAVKAFPLYGEWQAPQPPRDPQRPPRDPLSAEQHHLTAVMAFEKIQKDTSLSTEEKRNTILKGIAAEDRALAINPDYVSAITYKNILLRMLANLADDPRETIELLTQANQLRTRALELLAAGVPQERAANGAFPPPPPPPPPSPAYLALIDEMKPVRIGGNVKTPAKIRDVKPVYPPIARMAGVQGVVILEILIDANGDVAEAHVLRSIPLLDEAALSAVKDWRFMPTYLNGTPTAVIMTVTVNFTQQ
jgi:TonB family protein